MTGTSLTTRYGNWTSPITPSLITQGQVSFDEVRMHQKQCYFIERRPQEKGRCVIVRLDTTNNRSIDLLPESYSARSRVHEYGGGSYLVCAIGVFFVNDQDQDIYLVDNGRIRRITELATHRFADFVYDAGRNRLISICEIHQATVENCIVAIDLDTNQVDTLVGGDDFYASPRLNPDANALCWQSWNHPDMPWDGNRLSIADITENGKLDNVRQIAGGRNISTFQPGWLGGQLYFISDDTGWWQLYRYDTDTASCTQLTDGEREFGLPQWVFGQSTWCPVDEAHILCSYQQHGRHHLALLNTVTTELQTLATRWQSFSQLACENGTVALVAAAGDCFPQLVTGTIAINANHEATLYLDVARQSCQLDIEPRYFSHAQTLRFENRHGQIVYASYYPPCNPEFDHPQLQDDRPPMIVICHGGPTGQSDSALDPRKQFWTSRGFALLDVNYSGSTGYGRDYRERLNGRWGVLDVEDCCDAADYAVSQGLANPKQLVIRGSSAGGLTVLAALAFHDTFTAGASYYGVAELSSLAEDTHKFESRYLDRLVGPYPEAAELYCQRSPLLHVEQLNCPVIFFHGKQDRVVPIDQAKKMLQTLEHKGVTVAAQYFDNEQHGFRQAQTIIDSLENELAFYRLVFSLESANEIEFHGDLKLYNRPT